MIRKLAKYWFWFMCALFSLFFLFNGFILHDMGIIFWTLAFIFLWGSAFFMFRPPKYNGLLWKHPENGGGIELVMRNPEKGQKQWKFQFRWYDVMMWWPCYFWYEEKEGEDYNIKPFVINYSGIMTPEVLSDTVNWDELYDAFPDEEPALNKIAKQAIPMLLIGGLIFATIIVLDMLPKAAAG